MKTITSVDEAKSIKNPVSLVLGNFDGVHKGHQALINQCVVESKSKNWDSCVLTFDPHPSQVITGLKKIKFLNTKEQKVKLISKLDVNYYYMMPFDKIIASTDPKKFVEEYLLKVFSLKKIFIGFNYTFGDKAKGTPELLKSYGEKYGFQVSVFKPVIIGREVVSSTLIRKKISMGDISGAASLLGYWPILEGVVMTGDQRGRKMGFPTANFAVSEHIQLPSYGVYAVFAIINDKTYPAIANIGVKPSFGINKPIVEVHIFNFAEEIYNENITISLIQKIRDEICFQNQNELSVQIKQDIKDAKHILNIKKTDFAHKICFAK